MDEEQVDFSIHAILELSVKAGVELFILLQFH
jgi:hypothetical protein